MGKLLQAGHRCLGMEGDWMDGAEASYRHYQRDDLESLQVAYSDTEG